MYINPFIEHLHRVKFHEERGGVLRLDMNENPGGLPEAFVQQTLEKITPSFLSTYPEKDGLTHTLAETLGVAPENVTLTCGSDEAMRLVFQCFGQAGKKLLSVTPTFEMYGVYAAMFGMGHVTRDYENGFNVSARRLIEAMDDDTGIVALLNPNSPVGAVYTVAEAEAVIEAAARHGALVMIDEAYFHYYGKSFLPLAMRHQNALVLRTFSKLCSLAGLRVGYVVGPASLVDVLERAEATFNVNSVGILFAQALLARPDIQAAMRAEEAEGHAWLADTLRAAGYSPLSLEGNFLLFPTRCPSAEVVAALKEKKVWTRDYSRGPIAGYLRVSTGGLPYMQRFWDAFAGVDG